MRFHQLEQWLLSPDADSFFRGKELPIKLLQDSQKFYAGDAELIGKFDLTEFPRLPFNPVAVEFSVITEAGARQALIAIAIEDPDGEWFVTTFQRHGSDLWLPLGVIQGNRGAIGGQTHVNPVTLDVLFVMKDVAKLRAVQNALHSQWHLLSRFFEIINCSNLTTETVLPTSALNKKRMRAGKVPIYAYKVLTMRRGASSVRIGSTTDTRRVHLVRGHIKRRKTGNFWWQPFARGDKSKGIVTKDYRADRLIQKESRPA